MRKKALLALALACVLPMAACKQERSCEKLNEITDPDERRVWNRKCGLSNPDEKPWMVTPDFRQSTGNGSRP